MATLTITIPDAVATRVLTGFSNDTGYHATITNPTTGEVTNNPESRTDYSRRMLREYIVARVKHYEATTAAADARAAAEADVDADISLS
jgi:hypothetical protein